MIKKEHIIDRLDKALFNPDETKLNEKELEILERIRAAFVIWNDNPMKSDNEIRDFLMNTYHISKSQAYRDIINTKICLGNIKAVSKEWLRFRANTIIEEAYKAATEGDHKRAKSLTLIANSLVKINKLDVEEGEQIDWEKLIPQQFEPTSDPQSIGLKPIPELQKKISELKKKYFNEISIEIPYEETNANPNKETIFQ